MRVFDSNIVEEKVEATPKAASICPGIHATVKADVLIDSETADLEVKLEITAINQTSSSLLLEKPYPIPRFKGLQNLAAIDCKNAPLRVVRSGGGGLIYFPDGLEIAAGGEYTWTVSFNCACSLQRQDDDILGPYPIRAQDEFNGVKVSSHDFKYTFFFQKPKPRRHWPFKEVVVRQVNDLGKTAKLKKKFGGTACSLSFSLNEGQALRLFLAAHYRFSSAVAIGLTVLGSLAFSKWGADLIIGLLLAFYSWLGSALGS